MAAQQSQEGIIIAGFGGQGIVLAGRLLAHAAMIVGKEVTYIPAYGAEVRGGTSNCSVVISSEPIACPIVSHPDVLIVMNKASLVRFVPALGPRGVLLYNSSLIDAEPQVAPSVRVVAVPADQIAVRIGSQRAANMVMLGAYTQVRKTLSPKDLSKALPHILAERYHRMIGLNTQALHAGAEFAHEQATRQARTERLV